MKVFVAGATGVLGRGVVQELVRCKHEVVGLSRSDANDATLRALGASARRADIADTDALARAMEDCEAVVRAATHIPTKPRPKASEWAQNDRVRRDGTRALLDAAKRAGARRYVQESIVWLARPDDGTPFDERSPPRPDAMTQSALDAERMADAPELSTASLRFGWFYGPTSSQTRELASMLRGRRMPVLGDGRARLSFTHVDDAAAAIATAVESDARGVFHVVDERPTAAGDFFDAFAREIGAPRPMRVPVWLGRLAAGAFVARFLTTPMLTTSTRFREATAWRPRYPTVEEGLRQVARELNAARPSSSA